ncbi:hypothetical protein ES705_00588 [subsurface metagenome]|nr:hypothetical protein [Clostridia bacterium]
MQTKLVKSLWAKKIIRVASIVVLISIFTVTIVSCKGAQVRGSGNLISEDRDVSGFSKVSISGSGNLFIEQGDEESLTIEAEDNILPLITTRVSGSTLTIKINRGIPTKSPNYYLKVKDLTSISTSGSVSVSCPSLSTDSLVIKSSGSGNITLAGTVTSQDIESSGSFKYYAEDLKSNSCVIDSSGSGDLTVNVSDDLNIDVSGSVKVTYIGSPSITQKTSGSATITSK